jgi:hypothetical protein
MTQIPFAAQVSVFHGTTNTTPVDNVPLAAVLQRIQDGTYHEEIERLRRVFATAGKATYATAKRRLDAVTFCGTFSPTRAKTNLIQHSCVVHGDVDHLEDLHGTKHVLCTDPHLLYCFTSPSGDGLKMGVRIAAIDHDVQYKHAWGTVADYYQQSYGVTWDPSGKDVSRLCYMSWDPACYVNPHAPLFPVPLMVVPPPRPPPPRPPRDAIPSERRQRYAQQALDTAVQIIDASAPGTRHHARAKASYLLGGYVAGGVLDYSAAYAALEAAVRRNTANLPASMQTIADCLHAGMDAAISLDDLESEWERWRAAQRTIPLLQRQTSAYQRRLTAAVARYKRQLSSDPYFGAPARRGQGIPPAVVMYKETSHE